MRPNVENNNYWALADVRKCVGHIVNKYHRRMLQNVLT